MKRARFICPECGSVAVDAGAKLFRCLNCGHQARRFPRACDMAGPSAGQSDGRPRAGGQVLKCRGAE